jgi:hypothetical protein
MVPPATRFQQISITRHPESLRQNFIIIHHILAEEQRSTLPQYTRTVNMDLSAIKNAMITP